MTAVDTLNAGMAQRGMVPLTFWCGCCGDKCSRDDIASTSGFPQSYLDALTLRYNAPVCFGCADAHQLCFHCDAPIKGVEVITDSDELHWCWDCYEPSESDLSAEDMA